jgi:ABC-type transport system involved in cytochrome c biogenesis ATPase subunit
MRLLGVELSNFACFVRRFIPIRPGVQILVGKNNAGKTAILRGLAAMSRLPFSIAGTVDPGLAGYSRDADGSSSFGLNVWFGADADDWPLFAQDGDQPPFYDPATSKLVFRFRVWPQHKVIALNSCVLLTGTVEVELVRHDGGGNYLLSRIDEKGVIRRNEGMRLLASRGAIGDVGSLSILAPSPLFKGLLPLMNVQWVEARRYVQPDLQAQEQRVLPANAQSLGPYLLTLRGLNRKVYNRIQDFILRIFPEFDALNVELRGSTVNLTLTLAGTDTRIPLGLCGSGVEQLLALTTFLLTIPAGTTVLLDEPHTYLHPSAEREFISLLMDDTAKNYVISTHSPVMMNAVTSDRIINVVSGEEGSFRGSNPKSVGPILLSLGYKNSDFLLYDRLILGEGKSDAAVLPILLKNSRRFGAGLIERTGFPRTEGADSSSSTKKQTIILRYEKMLQELEMSSIPRLYLRDGDAAQDERATLEGTKQPATGKDLSVKFLPCAEIENFLLVPGAIARAMQVLKQFSGGSDLEIKEAEVKALLDKLLASDDPKLFPTGRGASSWNKVKGSAVLGKIFEKYGLRYDKESAGALIAEHVTPEDQPALQELVKLFAGLFSTA